MPECFERIYITWRDPGDELLIFTYKLGKFFKENYKLPGKPYCAETENQLRYEKHLRSLTNRNVD